MSSLAGATNSLSGGTLPALRSVGVWFRTMAVLAAICLAAAAPAAAQAARNPAATPKPAPPSPKSTEELAKAEKDRLANLKKALAESAAYWTELIKRYPESPRCEQAFYNLGVIYCECEQWKEAGEILDKFVRGYPNSPLAGDAHIRLIDIAFERRFDLQLADQLADASQKWIAITEGNSANAAAMPALWRTPPPLPDEDQAKSTTYNLRLRAIFAAYLSEKYDKAKQLLAAAGPLEPTDGRIDAQKVQKVGLFFLQKAILAQKPVWNVDVLAKAETDPQRTALKLADLYLKVMRPEKTAAIYGRIIDKDPVFAPARPSLEVYACIQLARSYSYDQKNRDKALDTLQTLYRPDLAKEPQIPEGLVWLGTMTFNFTQDPNKAMPHLDYVIKHFPDSPSAERAMYFYVLAAIAAKDKTLAETACKGFLAKYPQSTWAKHVTSLLNNEIAKLPTKERSSK